MTSPLNKDWANAIGPYVPLLVDDIAPPTGDHLTTRRQFRQSSDTERAEELALRNHERLRLYRAAKAKHDHDRDLSASLCNRRLRRDRDPYWQAVEAERQRPDEATVRRVMGNLERFIRRLG